MNLFEFQLLKHSATGQSFLWDSLDFQTTLHNLAGSFLVLIERVGVDIQRGRRLTVSEKPHDRADVRAAGDEQACRRVAQAVNIQVRRQIVCLEDFLEAPSERRGRHRQFHAFSAEHIVILGLLAPIVTLRFGGAEGFIFAEQAFHLGGEVHIPVARFRFRGFHDDLVASRFDRVPADVDAAFGVVAVLPLERTALTAPHSGRDDELEVSFVQDAHGLQRLNQLFHSFIVRNLFLFLLPRVFVGAPRGIVIEILRRIVHHLLHSTTKAHSAAYKITAVIETHAHR